MSIIENKVIGNTLLLTINNASKRNSMIKGFHDEFQKSIIDAEDNANIFSSSLFGISNLFLSKDFIFSSSFIVKSSSLLETSISNKQVAI